MERNADRREASLQYEKGITAFNERNYKEAADYFEDAARVLDNFRSTFALGVTYSKLQENKKAMEAYIRAYGLVTPESGAEDKRVQLLVRIAKEAGALRRTKEAEAYLQEALQRLPQVKDRVREHELREEIAEQRRMMMSVEKGVKKNLAAEAFERGKAMEERRSYDEAAEEYTKSLEIKETAVAIFRRARCYQELGRFEDAAEGYVRCLKPGSDSEQIRVSDCWLNLGLCYLELGDYESACNVYSNTVKNCYDRSKRSKALKHLQVAKERREVSWGLK